MPRSPLDYCSNARCKRRVARRGFCDECQGTPMANGGRLTLVTGPPCSGKTTYVRERRQSDDMVIDFDALAMALGAPSEHVRSDALFPFAGAARDAVIARLAQPHDLSHAWVIACAPTRAARRHPLGATIVILDTSREECHARADRAGRPVLWHRLIDRYFEDFESDGR